MTPLDKFGPIYLKREDQNVTGSTKDRAIEFQIKNLLDLGFKSAVISSTGNAAISAAHYCSLYHLPLVIFVSPQINPQKLKLLSRFEITSTPKPISEAIKFSKANHSYLLRQSTDPTALLGYQQIALELNNQLSKITSIFIPVGSGTTLLGISKRLLPNVKIFAVQPASHCPIASHYDHQFIPEKTTVTDALSVKMLPLKNQIISAINRSQGRGVVAQNQAVISAYQQLLDSKINVSPESALALAGYYKIKDTVSVGDFPVILLTGTQR